MTEPLKDQEKVTPNKKIGVPLFEDMKPHNIPKEHYDKFVSEDDKNNDDNLLNPITK